MISRSSWFRLACKLSEVLAEDVHESDSSNDCRRSLCAYERTSSALGEGAETPFAMTSSCSPSAGKSLTSLWASHLAQLREMRTARVAAVGSRCEKWS